MISLEDFIYKQTKSVIRKITPQELSDIYVYSFFVSDIDDDPRHPSLTIGYNTRTNLKETIKDATSAEEAKWDYAFWLQNELAVIGKDVTSQELIEEWIENKNLYYTDGDEDDDYETCVDKGEKITTAFNTSLIHAVQQLHVKHVTNLPILIHELDYDDDIKKQNIRANGIKRVGEFTTWIDGGGK